MTGCYLVSETRSFEGGGVGVSLSEAALYIPVFVSVSRRPSMLAH